MGRGIEESNELKICLDHTLKAGSVDSQSRRFGEALE